MDIASRLESPFEDTGADHATIADRPRRRANRIEVILLRGTLVAIGTLRHFAVAQRLGRFRGGADMEMIAAGTIRYDMRASPGAGPRGNRSKPPNESLK